MVYEFMKFMVYEFMVYKVYGLWFMIHGSC